MTRTAGSRLVARALAVATALPLAAGLGVAAAPAASAAVTSPGNGTVYTSYSTITINASYPRSSSDHTLTLTSPGGPAVTVATAPAGLNPGTMSYSLDTGCWTYPSPSCSGRRLAPNGTWTVTQSGGDSGSSTFVTRIRPEAPAAVTASPLNPREVRVSWRLGAEPDLTGWVVLEGDTAVKDGIGRSACDGSTCSTVIGYGSDGTGEHTYTVRALRATAPNSTTTLESPSSAPATARLEAAPQSPPSSPAPSDGGSSEGGSSDGGSDDGSTDGGSGSEGGSSDGGSSDGGSTSGGSTSGGGSTPAPSGASPSSGSGSTGSGSTAAPIGTTTGGGEAAASADQQAVAQRKAFALGFSAFGPKLGIPKLPPLPQAQAPAIAPELADGTYEPTLGFEEQTYTERVETTAAAPRQQRVRNVVGSALDSERLLTSAAGALVLLLAGAHLRRWLSAAREDI